ncbi:30S ribosomal protein S19 [Candidatus Altiarchaeota archaeon]
MARKEFFYRGHKLDELKAMSMDELIKILPSRARRSLLRGFTEPQKKLLAEVRSAAKILSEGGKTKIVKTHVRDTVVLPEMVGLTIAIYTGKEYSHIIIQPEMIGKYLGELTVTRRLVKHNAPGVGATRSSMFVPIR